MENEFNLSEKIVCGEAVESGYMNALKIGDVKEFIRLFKVEAENTDKPLWEILDKLAGDKLGGSNTR